MSYTATCVRARSAGVFATVFTVALLGCGAQAPAHSDTASRADTSALPAPARTFLSTLNDRQRADVSFPFDDPERTNWAYVPQSRKGLALGAMNAEQRAAAFASLGTGLSERGTRLAHGIIELEGTLRELEGAVRSLLGPRRDPDLYYLSLFVGPGGPHPWGWRFEAARIRASSFAVGRDPCGRPTNFVDSQYERSHG